MLLVLLGAGFTLVCGRLADMVGRRRMFRSGMALLIAASLLGGLAVDPALLLIARAFQGFVPALFVGFCGHVPAVAANTVRHLRPARRGAGVPEPLFPQKPSLQFFTPGMRALKRAGAVDPALRRGF